MCVSSILNPGIGTYFKLCECILPYQLVQNVKNYLDITSDPPTFMQVGINSTLNHAHKNKKYICVNAHILFHFSFLTKIII